ncbi:MAG TPA: stage II sporulation protein M, partial [Candidatus Dormibacteraeota bacterium]|nr:stage II sporulation protein M [Candidatus Dormibacteraeota bacterium]
MRAEDFVALRKDDWNRLEDLLARAGGGQLNSLAPAQVLTVASLYRRATADLARAQRDWPGEPVHRYLNGLVARGHGIVYRRGGDVRRRIRVFYTETLPRTYREAAPYLLAAGALLFVPAFVSYFVMLANPDAAYAIGVSPKLIDEVRHHKLWTHIPPDARIAAAGLIMTNNIWVSMLAFALGAAFGLPVMWVMITNGIGLGGLFGL